MCSSYEKECESVQESSTPLELFPPSATRGDVAMNIVGNIVRSRGGSTNNLVINVIFTKIAQSIPMKDTNAFQIAQAYSIIEIANNGPQFSAKIHLQV